MTPLNRRSLALLALVPAIAAITACGSSSNSSGGSASANVAAASPSGGGVVRVAYINAPSPYGIEAWGVSQGIFSKYLKQAGISKVKFIEFANGPDANAAQASGAVDVALVGGLPGVTGRAGGLPTRLLGVDETDYDAWLIAKKGTIGSVSQLAGKTIGFPFGSYLDQYAHELVAAEGLTGKVQFANILPPAGLTAVASGNVAAYVGPPVFGAAALNKLGLAVIDHADNHTPSLGGIDVSTVTSAFADAHPGFAKAWNDAVVASRANAEQHPVAYYKFNEDGLTLAQSEQVNSIKLTLPTNQLDPASLQAVKATAEYVVDHKIQPTLVNVQSWILDPSATGLPSGG